MSKNFIDDFWTEVGNAQLKAGYGCVSVPTKRNQKTASKMRVDGEEVAFQESKDMEHNSTELWGVFHTDKDLIKGEFSSEFEAKSWLDKIFIRGESEGFNYNREHYEFKKTSE